MATPQEELAELNRQIADLKRQLGDTSEFVPIQNLQDAQRLFVSMKREVDAIGEGLSFVAKSFRDSVSELSKQNSELSASKSALKSISNTAQKILTTRSLEGDISEKELANLEKRAQLQFESLKIAIQSGRLEGNNLLEAQNALKSQEDFFKATQDIRREQAIINKDSGVKLFTGLEDITNAIPGLNKFTGAFKEASKAAKEQARFNQTAFGSSKGLTKEQISQNKEVNQKLNKYKSLRAEGVKISDALTEAGVSAKQVKVGSLPVKSVTAFQAGFKALGPIIKGALGPLALLKELADALIVLDKRTGDLAKNLGISYQNAFALQKSFNRIANTSGNIMINSKGINEAFAAISKELGTNGQLSDKLLLSQTRLVEQAFYSVEAATQLSKLSLALGENSEDITREFLGQVEALNAQNGLTVNSKQLLEASLKISKATLITLTAQKGELGRAAFEAKKLGLELSKIDAIAGGLLEIEQSIGAEFEAEVISGRQLTLERARYYALTNDLAGVAKELSDQGITQEYYANANRIEQEAVAKAMGMSRDEMGAMLLEQKALSQIGVESAAKAKEKFEDLKAQYGIEGAIAKLGNEQYAQQLASASIADKFSKTMEKLKSVFGGIAEALMPLIDTLTIVFDLVGSIIKIIDPLLQLINIAVAGVADLVNLFRGDFDFNNITTAWDGAKKAMEGSPAELITLGDPSSMMKNLTIKAAGDAMIPATSDVGNAIYSPTENTLFKGTKNDVAILQPKNSLSSINTPQGAESIQNPSNEITKNISVSVSQESKPLEVRGLDKLLSVLSIQTESSISGSVPTPTPQESKPLEVRGLDKLLSVLSPPENKTLEIKGIDKLLSALSLGMVKSTEPNTSTPILQGEKLGTESRLPIVQPTPVLKTERTQPSTVTLSAADVKAIADAVRDGAMQGTSRAKLVAEIEPRTIDRMSNSIQPYLATNTYSNSL